jgi:hypothetical protein
VLFLLFWVDYTYLQIKHNIDRSSVPDISGKMITLVNVLDGDSLKLSPRGSHLEAATKRLDVLVIG